MMEPDPKWRWGSERSRTGGIDEIPLHHCSGRLFLCGKHHVGADVLAVLAAHSIDVVVCLTQRHEIEERYPDYLAWLQNHPDIALWAPIPDLGVIPDVDMVALIERLDDLLADGRTLLVHCAAGIGRSGTVAVGVLLRHGISLDQARSLVATHRPLAGPETGPQRDFVERYAQQLAAAD